MEIQRLVFGRELEVVVGGLVKILGGQLRI